MAYLGICDLCMKKIKLGGFSIRVTGEGMFRDADYCKECWTDKTKWEKIHRRLEREQT